MTYDQALKEGQLEVALADVEQEIRSQPSEVKHRIFLFQLLAVQSQWQRALKQLDVIAKLDDGALAMVHEYRSAIECEQYREQVFSGNKDPVFVGQPHEWQALMLQALKLTAENKDIESQTLRNKAFEMAPATSGTINGDSFAWIADADSRLGPLLEVFVEGQYRWVSFSNIKRMAIEAPENLRDFVWMPAHIQWQTEGESFVLIPTRYPSSADQSDQLALSQKTEWLEKSEGCFIGYGQKIFATDVSDYPLLDIRDVFFNPVSTPDEDE